MNEREEKLLKTLIYEEHNRKKLAGSRTVPMRWKKLVPIGVAASVGFLIYASSIIGFQEKTRSEQVSQVYTFPDFEFTRSAPSRIDLFKEELAGKKYSQVLDSLRYNSMSDKDRLAQSHLLFVLDSLDQLEAFITDNPLENDQFSFEIEWLSFLAAYKKGISGAQLESKLDILHERYLDDAKSLLKALD